MKTRHIVTTACAASLFVLALFQYTSAMGVAEKTTYLTFSQPVRLPGVSLAAGTYTFEVANANTTGDIVRVSSRDGKMAYFLGFTQRVPRPSGLRSDAHVSLGEAGPGVARPITVWWNDFGGQQFIYRDR